MHLADAFIQSDLHCIQVTVSTFLSTLDKHKCRCTSVAVRGNNPEKCPGEKNETEKVNSEHTASERKY